MGKQAIGTYATNFQHTMSTLQSVLFYPQKPLVTTRSMKYVHFADMPAGQNAIVAIACYTGYNQEDSVIMNQSSIDRGLFRSMALRTYSEREKKAVLHAGDNVQHVVEQFCVPTKETTMGTGLKCYAKLDAGDGLIYPGQRVSGSDVLVGKRVLLTDDEQQYARAASRKYRDTSFTARSTDAGVIDRVMLCEDATNTRTVRVALRSMCTPQIGDKFSSVRRFF